MKKFTPSFIFLLLIITGCSTKKAVNDTQSSLEENKKTEQMLKEGYIQAIIEENLIENCGFVIKNINSGDYLIPIEMEDSFKKAGIKIWLKYRPIKPIQGACKTGTPIAVEDIILLE